MIHPSRIKNKFEVKRSEARSVIILLHWNYLCAHVNGKYRIKLETRKRTELELQLQTGTIIFTNFESLLYFFFFFFTVVFLLLRCESRENQEDWGEGESSRICEMMAIESGEELRVRNSVNSMIWRMNWKKRKNEIAKLPGNYVYTWFELATKLHQNYNQIQTKFRVSCKLEKWLAC